MHFSAWKRHLKKWYFDPLLHSAPRWCQGTFFLKVILYQFLKRKNRALLSKNVQAILTLLNLAQKVPFLDDLKKKYSKSDWNQRHNCVCYPQIYIFFGPPPEPPCTKKMCPGSQKPSFMDDKRSQNLFTQFFFRLRGF